MPRWDAFSNKAIGSGRETQARVFPFRVRPGFPQEVRDTRQKCKRAKNLPKKCIRPSVFRHDRGNFSRATRRMASGQVPSVLRYLRQLVGQRSDPDTDRHLLERFATRRDETAFATLLERHGPMVRGVCLRVLHDDHEADDAFQATFLVLARKAASVSWQESVGGWLHEVAYRVARKARTAAAQAAAVTQRLGQREVAAMPSADPLSQVVQRELP